MSKLLKEIYAPEDFLELSDFYKGVISRLNWIRSARDYQPIWLSITSQEMFGVWVDPILVEYFPKEEASVESEGVTKRYALAEDKKMRQTAFVDQHNIIRLVMGSKKPEAKRFEKWAIGAVHE